LNIKIAKPHHLKYKYEDVLSKNMFDPNIKKVLILYNKTKDDINWSKMQRNCREKGLIK